MAITRRGGTRFGERNRGSLHALWRSRDGRLSPALIAL